MEHSNELLDAWVGKLVMIQAALGPYPAPNEEQMKQVWDNPGHVYHSLPHAGLWVIELVAYDSLGVVLRRRAEDAHRFFMPWSAVISIRGGDPDAPDE